MKQLSQLAAGAALVLATLGSSSAIAGPTCQLGCSWVGLGPAGKANTFVGSFNSATPDVDAVSFTRSLNSSITTFTDVWVFELNPAAGNYFINSFFNITSGGINNFKVELFNVTASGCSLAASNLAGHCNAGYTLGSSIAVSGPPVHGGTSIEGVQPLAAPAFYAWVVSGTRVGSSAYMGSASITQPVPEPTSLALVGVALLAAAVGARRKRSA